MDFLMRKRILSAEQALELGLVHEVVEPAELRKTPMALAEELAEGPQVAMRLLKRSIYNAPKQTFEQAYEDIATKIGIVDHHLDTREGVQLLLRSKNLRTILGSMNKCPLSDKL